jgi:hypothetical protein
MTKLDFAAKREICAQTRRQNYLASLQLEGIALPDQTANMSREQLIEFYRNKAAQASRSSDQSSAL